ncbi:phage major capsid protein [Massilia sp. DWR3-1-1]|uniref:phage major capsid protein n=1 Tax=Massilia sp. DWR3-1-1 TaxID=2804559 RepID=UPI003CF00AF6
MKNHTNSTPLLTKSGMQAGDDNDVAAAITTFSKAANARIDTTDSKVKSLTELVSGVKAEVMELAQKAVRRPGGGNSSDDESTDSVSSIVLKSDGLDLIRADAVKNLRISVKGFGLGQKAAVTNTDTHARAERDTEIYGPLGRRTAVRDLLVTRPTTAPSIEYLLGTRTGSAAIQAAEGDQKAEMALAFELKQAPVRTIAVWIPASRQALDDEALLADYIDTELRDALQLTEDAQLLKGNGTGVNINGLWTQAVAYSRAVVGDSPSDTLRRAITQVQLARGVATGVVINPIGLELLELDKDNEGRYQLAYTVTDADGRTSVWRVPVVVTDALAANEFLVGDFSRAARLYDRQQATVEIATQHADFFTRNLVAILAEERLALAVNRPDMLVKGTFTTV